jgi:hypothetical protein
VLGWLAHLGLLAQSFLGPDSLAGRNTKPEGDGSRGKRSRQQALAKGFQIILDIIFRWNQTCSFSHTKLVYEGWFMNGVWALVTIHLMIILWLICLLGLLATVTSVVYLTCHYLHIGEKIVFHRLHEALKHK